MEIIHILSVEKLRDGGSLIAAFQSKDSCEYWLMYPIANVGENPPKYKRPILVNRSTGLECELALSVANQWLAKLKPHIESSEGRRFNSVETEIKIFKEMIALSGENT